jgi:hypothetical protein
MSASVPVAIASDQTLPLPTGAATSANQTTANTSLTGIETNTSDTASGIGDVNTNLGILTETAPGTDTASSGLNGRLQRIAQRITSLIALFPTSLTGSGNFKTAISEALPAGTSVIGQVAATNETSTVFSGTTALTPKFAKISASSSGNNTIVAAVVGKKIRVLAYNFIANGTVNGKFQDGAGGTDLTGLKYCVVNSGMVAPYNPVGWFETSSNTLLNLNLSGAVSVGGELVYVEV